MQKIKVLSLIVGLALIAAACNKSASNTNTNPTADTTPANSSNAANQTAPITVQLTELNSSKEAGTATLTSVGNNQTQVKIDVSSTSTTPQPAHIHMGACPTPGEVKYPLSNVVSGKSTTVINASLDDLLAALPLAINIHKSATEINSYVSCGDIKAPAAAAAQSGTMEVDITSSGFSPSSITVKSGTVVVFKNTDASPHRVASNPHPTHTDLPGFDSLTGLAQGATYSFTFTKIGTWGYHDHFNPSTHGSVTVVE